MRSLIIGAMLFFACRTMRRPVLVVASPAAVAATTPAADAKAILEPVLIPGRATVVPDLPWLRDVDSREPEVELRLEPDDDDRGLRCAVETMACFLGRRQIRRSDWGMNASRH